MMHMISFIKAMQSVGQNTLLARTVAFYFTYQTYRYTIVLRHYLKEIIERIIIVWSVYTSHEILLECIDIFTGNIQQFCNYYNFMTLTKYRLAINTIGLVKTNTDIEYLLTTALVTASIPFICLQIFLLIHKSWYKHNSTNKQRYKHIIIKLLLLTASISIHSNLKELALDTYTTDLITIIFDNNTINSPNLSAYGYILPLDYLFVGYVITLYLPLAFVIIHLQLYGINKTTVTFTLVIFFYIALSELWETIDLIPIVTLHYILISYTKLQWKIRAVQQNRTISLNH